MIVMPRGPEQTVPGLDREALLSDPGVTRWRSNLARGSLATADVWLRRLRAFCARTGKLPTELLQLKPRELQDLFLDFVTAEEKRGSSGPYIAHTVAVARSWLKFSGIDVPVRVKIREADHVKEETPLSREQIRAVLNAASPKERVACILMVEAGLRPEVLGSYAGDDGLRLRDLPEIKVENGVVAFAKVPTMIVVPSELSKAGHRYPTFLGEEGCGILKDYLEARLKAGEPLGPESSVVKPERAKKPFIRTINIGDAVRHALRTAGFKEVRPYCLRTTFASALLEAENDGKVAHPFTVLWLGHKGEMSARYSANRGKLASSMLDRMREAYRRCEPYLSTISSGSAQTEGQERVLRMTLKYLGVPDTALEGKRLIELPDDDLNALVEKHRGGSTGHAALPGPKQQVIAESELPKFLAEGWVAKMPVNGSKFVVERA
jgi:integrase